MLGLISGCKKSLIDQGGESMRFSSFRDVPGVTQDEIRAIEALREQVLNRPSGHFVYSVLLSTEAFIDSNGNIRGWSALFCEWLTEFFDIPFKPEFVACYDFMAKLASFEVDFTGAMKANEERRRTYFMTSAIALQYVSSFRLINSIPLEIIAQTRPLRYAFIYNTLTIQQVTSRLEPGTFEVVLVSNTAEARQMLHSGEADVFFNPNITEVAFDIYGDVVARDFFPMILNPVPLTTKNPELEPVISVMEKALQTSGTRRYLAELYNTGYQEYLRHKLFTQLTEEERRFIQTNPVIPVALEASNYPVSFFNTHEGEWQGIAVDVLKEVKALTGLRFERVNNENATFPDLLGMLENHEASMISELMRTREREGSFLWPDTAFMKTYFSLISRQGYKYISLNEIFHTRVGLLKGYATTDYFHKWFPDHPFAIEYESNLAAFDALDRGEIDVVMTTSHELLFLTHFLEQPGYKINFLFDYSFDSTFGINKDNVILHSIVSKTLRLINTNMISGQWMRRTFDYRVNVVEAQRPWLIGASVLLSSILILITVLFVKNRRAGKHLENLVKERTRELELQTVTLTTLFDTIPDLIFTKDLNLHFTQCNKSFAEHFGMCKKDFIGKSTTECLDLPIELANEYDERDSQAVKENRTFIFEEYIPRIDGANPFYETVNAPLIVDNSVVGLLIISRDITKRKELERRLASDYEYANKLSDSLARITKSPAISAGDLKAAADIIVQEGCVALNTHRVSAWTLAKDSEALENISCYDSSTRKHRVQDNFDLLSRKEYAELLKSERLVVTSNVEECYALYLAEEGSGSLFCALLDAPIRIDGTMVGVVCAEQDRCEEFPEGREWTIAEKSFVSSLADLMALAISGAERRRAYDAAKMASQIKSAFLAHMSHEIRTPMNSIVGFSELAMGGEIQPKTKDYLAKIMENSQWLLQIINDILDISKVESGKMELERVPFDMHSLFLSCRTIMMPKAIEKGITLHFYAEPNIGKMPLGDPIRLRQVLVNLLSNAVKFSNTGTVKLLAKIKEKTNETVTMYFEVSDSGIGMTAKQLEKIFEPFAQAESGITRKYGGTGLGLTITKNIVELMGGKLSVESIFGVGSKFSFELCFDITDEISNAAEQKNIFNELEKPVFKGEVLLCEDNAMNQRVICEHLERVGLKTVVADNGEIGVTMVRDRKEKGGEQFNLIFMDIHMPVMDGLEAAAKIIELNPEIPIVALTANIMPSDKEAYNQSGMKDCVGKPFTSQELWRCLMKYFEPISWQHVDEGNRAKSEAELWQKLTGSFVKDNRNRLSEIETAINTGDIKLAHRLVHTLKSNAGQLGKTLLQQAAANVEHQLKDGKNLVTEEQLKILETELNTALAELDEDLALSLDKSSEAASQSKGEQKYLDTKSVQKLIEKLELLLDMGNPDCLQLVNDIHRIPEPCAEPLSDDGSSSQASGLKAKVIQQIEDFDFVHAIVTLAEFKKRLEIK
ncbi:MAG: ATP-binding protein [Spirochaetaceae bacterium]|nr:ATP-binding protein [Spirochaetaceae bacterium]